MRIHLKDGRRRLQILLPTGLLFNNFTAGAAARSAAEYGVDMTPAQMRRFFRAVKEYKRNHPDWEIVDVQSADGQRVRIRL